MYVSAIVHGIGTYTKPGIGTGTGYGIGPCTCDFYGSCFSLALACFAPLGHRRRNGTAPVQTNRTAT